MLNINTIDITSSGSVFAIKGELVSYYLLEAFPVFDGVLLLFEALLSLEESAS